MKKILPVSLMVAAMFYGAVSQAQPQNQAPTQTPPQIQPQAPTLDTAENKTSLDDRTSACLKDNSCSTQVRLQIIQEENDAMNDHFQKIHQACADANFQNCIDKQKDDVQAWYSAQDNMQHLMHSIEAQDMNEKQPSAGEPSSASDMGDKLKAFWHKIWNPDNNQ